jgi:hypothetical protein
MRIFIPITFLVIASLLFLPAAESQMVQVVVAGKAAAAAPASIVEEQEVKASAVNLNGSGVATITIGSTKSGSLLVLYSGRVLTSAPSGGGTWSSVFTGSQCGYDSRPCELYYAPNVSSGTTSITVTNSADPFGTIAYVIKEFSGIATTSPLDQYSVVADAMGSPVSSASITTTNASALLLGMIYTADGAAPVSSGDWGTMSAQTAFASGIVGIQTRVVSSTGTYSATGTSSGGTVNNAQITAFKGL